MIEKIIKLTCDWCGDWQQSSTKYIGIKRFRKKAENWGWKRVVSGDGKILDFCCEECYENYKINEIKRNEELLK